MIVSVIHRRRAERFARLVDEATGARRHHVRSKVDDNLPDLVSVSRRLSDLPVRVEAQPEFRDGLRAMLMATIERDGIGATAAAPEPEPSRRVGVRSLRRPAGSRPAVARRTKARGAIVVGLAAGTLALSGMSAASGDALPGDALYSVKRSTERAQLALAGSDLSRGELYLEFARTRLDEARTIKDPTALAAILGDMDNETLQGVRLLTASAVDRRDPAALDAVDAFANAQRADLQRLRDGVSGEAHTRASSSVTILDEVLRRSQTLRPLLKCGTSAVNDADLYGPVPKATTCKTTGQRTGNPAGNQRGTNGTPGGADQEAPHMGNTGGPTESAPATGRNGSTAPGPSAPNPSQSTDGGLIGIVNDIFG